LGSIGTYPQSYSLIPWIIWWFGILQKTDSATFGPSARRVTSPNRKSQGQKWLKPLSKRILDFALAKGKSAVEFRIKREVGSAVHPVCTVSQGAGAGSRCRRFQHRYAAFIGRSPDTATAEDLRRFQLHQAQTGVRPPTINSAVAALRFPFDYPDRMLDPGADLRLGTVFRPLDLIHYTAMAITAVPLIIVTSTIVPVATFSPFAARYRCTSSNSGRPVP